MLDIQRLTERECQLLAHLAAADRYVSAIQLAPELHVSEKTISRDVQSIRDKAGCLDIILHQRGKGYMFNRAQKLPSGLVTGSMHGQDTKTRRRNMLVLLLLQAPEETSVTKLAEFYYVSSTSIVKDLECIEAELKKYQLSLARSCRGTHVEGLEINIRRLLMYQLGKAAGWQESGSEQDLKAMEMFFPSQDVHYVALLLDKAEKMLCGKIRDPYYINLLTHILIMMKRVENHESLPQTAEETEQADEYICKCSDLIANELSDYMGVEIPASETGHICQYIASSRIERDENVQQLADYQQVMKIVEKLIARVSDKLGFNLQGNRELARELLLHLQPLERRLQNHLGLMNPLCKEVQYNFPQVFTAVSQALKEDDYWAGFGLISDDEVAYLAVYFQAALEAAAARRKVGIVCSTGVGTSHLLAARVRRAFPDIEIVNILSDKQIGWFTPENTDLILTTVHLKDTDVPVVLVSAIFNELDVLKVRRYLQTHFDCHAQS